jgi:aminobenzoyl-glutamate utilization protein B
MYRHAAVAVAAITLAGGSWTAGQVPPAGGPIAASVDANKERYAAVARQIWEFAELGYQEEKSSALLKSTLAGAGFAVTSGVAGMPTAFTATYGSGTPVIAIIGEFDALPGLSQAAGEAARLPMAAGGAGHGCGHNLLGTAAAAAAIAVKDWLAETRRPGTLRYYGAPAEEGGGGKVYMLLAGLFSDVDAVVGWHPSDGNSADASSSLATIAATFRFHGAAAHAAMAPDKGRSALDGVEAFDYMLNLMREHVPQETRIHYVIKKGGAASNIVPDVAEGDYQARHPDMRVLREIWVRILKAAEGAALGTGTRVEHQVVTSYWNVLPNETLAGVQHRNLQRVGGVEYTAEEQAFAEKIRATLISPAAGLGSQSVVQPLRSGEVAPASTDMGDISWNVPTVQMSAATFVPGVPAHSWQAVACAGSSIGIKGMLVAAKTIALTVSDLYSAPATIAAAKEEFLRRRGGAGFKYSTLAPPQPPLDYRK